MTITDIDQGARLIPRLLAVSLLCLLTVACGNVGRDGLIITGSSTIAPLIQQLAARYEREHPNVRIDVQSGGSGRGLNDVRQGINDIAMVSRELTADEKAGGLLPHPIAHDGIALIVHRDNPVRALSSEQVRRIYLGRADKWSAVGGAERPVTVVNKAAGRATLAVFLAHFALPAQRIEADIIAGENQQVIQTVAGNRWAVGYVSIGAALAEIERGTPIATVSLDGEAPAFEAIRQGRYPLARTLNLVTGGEPRKLATDFIAFVRSEAEGETIRDFHFVPVSP